MALSITSVTRANGPTCEHVIVTVNDEGATRSFDSAFSEIDRLIDELGGDVQAKRVLVLLWAGYRRRQARAVTGVDIA